MDTIRVGMIGAGETGTPLLRELLAAPFVEVVGVADVDPGAPGLALAREHGRPTTGDMLDLTDLGDGVDVLIDVTGVPEVQHELRRRLHDAGNRHTVIMHEAIALLMMSLSQGRLVAGKHGATDYETASAGVPAN